MTHIVRYGRVTFTQVETRRFVQEVQYDESNTDFLFHRFRIRIAGSVHADQAYHLRSVVDAVTESTATKTMGEIQSALLHPRQLFEYQVGDDILLRAEAVRSPGASLDDVDLDNGPKPISCEITEIAGEKLYRVEFEIVLSLRKCGGQTFVQQVYGAERDLKVLSNRWSVADQRDHNFYNTRTFEGVLRVGHITYWPHVFRHLCVPPLQRGYQRRLMRFADDPTGLVLRYQVVDQQRFRAPPSPATDWKASYTESTGEGGAIGFGEMSIRLEGSKDSPTFQLLEAAAQVMFSRLGDITKTYEDPARGDYSVILKHLVITEHLDENVIELNARIQRASKDRKFLNATISQIGEPLDLGTVGRGRRRRPRYDPGKWPVPKLYDGSSPSGLFAKYLGSSCTPIHGLPQNISISPPRDDPGEDEQEQGQAQFYDSPQPITDDDQSGLSREQQNGFPYTYYTIESRYDIDKGWISLPLARFEGAGSRRPSSALIRIHEPVATRTVVIHAERVGDWPELPDPDRPVTDRNGILMVLDEFVPVTEAPELLPDGKSRLFKMEARYRYLMERAPTAQELLGAGADPRDVSLPGDNVFAGQDSFSRDRIL